MSGPRKTELRAKYLVEELVRTGNLESFIHSVGWSAYEFGRFNPYPRELFQSALVAELKKNLSHELFDKIVCKIAEEAFKEK